MINPDGKECPHFYGDYHRGKNIEYCRLLTDNDLDWVPEYCSVCPVPEILLANACEHMALIPRLRKKILFISPRVFIDAYCHKCNCKFDEPKVGCGECHPLPELLNWQVAKISEEDQETDENNITD